MAEDRPFEGSRTEHGPAEEARRKLTRAEQERTRRPGPAWLSPDCRVLSFRGITPVLAEDVFLAPGAMVVGDVILAERASVWHNAVVRGDMNFIRIGRETNIQDLCVLHVTTDIHPVKVGDGVTVGHAAVIHGATIEDGCLIGMKAVVLDGARIGEGAMIAAGALVPPGMEIPPRVLVVGSPARVRRSLQAGEMEEIRFAARDYVEYARLHAKELGLIAG
jgi:carbonic anhydrase/acetyltransferase-like protein (isoleucine patch superfamily)